MSNITAITAITGFEAVVSADDVMSEHARQARRAAERTHDARGRFGRFRTADGPPGTWHGKTEIGHAHTRLIIPMF